MTEKRIEDIISGRVGALSQRLAETALGAGGSGRFRSKEALEEEFRKTITQELEPELSAADKERFRREAAQEERALKEYQKFHQAVVNEFANHPGIKVEKIGDGSFDEKGDDLVDGVFTIGQNRLAVITLSTSDILKDQFQNGFAKFLRDVAKEIKKETFTKAIVCFDDELVADDRQAKIIAKVKEQIGADIMNNIMIIAGSKDTVIPKIQKLLTSGLVA